MLTSRSNFLEISFLNLYVTILRSRQELIGIPCCILLEFNFELSELNIRLEVYVSEKQAFRNFCSIVILGINIFYT